MFARGQGYRVGIPYTAGFYPDLAPLHLEAALLFAGFKASGARAGARYCELGCGYGLTTLILAASNPHMYWPTARTCASNGTVPSPAGTYPAFRPLQADGADDFVMVRAGYPPFKVFMTYDDLVLTDRQLLEVFTVAREQGALVMVHAEGYDQIKFMTDRLEREGKTHSFYHAASRPELVERGATHRAISHAELIGIPIVIVHVSGRAAMEQIQWAQGRGLKVYAKTCPQYLVLTAEDLKGLNMDMSGAKYVCSPPPRDAASQGAIWCGLESGVFETFSSDHCPFASTMMRVRPAKGREPRSAGFPTAYRALLRVSRSCSRKGS
jgi:dihydroorotase-like cyclic amidohydrolase